MTQIPEDMDLPTAHFPKSSIAANGYFLASWTIAYTFGWNHAFPLLLGPSSCGRRVSRSSSWIHKAQTGIISLWSRKPERHEEENHELNHEHSHLQYCICNSSFNNSAICSFCNVRSFGMIFCPHQTQNMWAKEVANHLHSVANLWIWHFRLLAVFYLENLIMGPPTSWRQAWISGKASCTRSSSLYIQYDHCGLKEEMYLPRAACCVIVASTCRIWLRSISVARRVLYSSIELLYNALQHKSIHPDIEASWSSSWSSEIQFPQNMSVSSQPKFSKNLMMSSNMDLRFLYLTPARHPGKFLRA